MRGAVLLTYFLAHVTLGQPFEVWDPFNYRLESTSDGNLQETDASTNSVDLADYCIRHKDCDLKGSLCIDNHCTCHESLVKRSFEGHDTCVPETVKYNVELKHNMDWTDEVKNKNSQEYKLLAGSIDSALKNTNDPLLVDYTLTDFERSEDNKVKSKIVVVYLNDDNHEHTRHKRSFGDFQENLKNVPGVSGVEIATDGDVNDLCNVSNSNMQCTADHSACSSNTTVGTCECRDGYIIIIVVVDNTNTEILICVEESQLGDPCVDNLQCSGSNQECDTICQCIDGNFIANDTSFIEGCYPFRDSLGDKCTIPEQCESIQNATCNSGFCECGDGYEQDGDSNTCIGNLILGSSCKMDSQCSTDYSYCSDKTECSCLPGYTQSGSLCLDCDDGSLGSTCSDDCLCNPDYICDGGVCTDVCLDGNIGDACNDNCPCTSDYECYGDTCAEACLEGDIGDACSDHCPCNADYECDSGFCAEVEYGVCYTTTDIHYIRFDGARYRFQDTCKYLLAADCANDEWEVITDNEPIFGAYVVFVAKVTFIIHNVLVPHEIRIIFDQGDIMVNGVNIANSDLPKIGSSYKIGEEGFMIVVYTDFGVTVKYHRRWFDVIVTLDRRWFNRTCGLCGAWNENTSDDIASVSDAETVQEETLYGEYCGVTPVNYNCSGHDFAKAEQLCEKFLQKYFCPNVSYDPIFEFCAFDVCVAGIDYLCRHLQKYSEQCFEVTNDTKYVVDPCACQPGDDGDMCWSECPCNSPYDCNYGVCVAATTTTTTTTTMTTTTTTPFIELGGACEATSDCDVDNSECVNNSCECASGYYANGKLTCAAVDGWCTASGNTYYSTFDGDLYYFQGMCEYILAADCVNAEWKVITQNEPIVGAFSAFVAKVTFIIHNVLIADEIRIVIDLKDIKVNGVVISNSDLPKIGSSYNITETAYGSYMIWVDTDFGVQVMYHRRLSASVRLDRRWFNNTCGLCGEWNEYASGDTASVSGPQIVHKEALHGDDCGVTPINYNCSRDDFATAEQLCEKFHQKYLCPNVSYDPTFEFCAFYVCVFGVDYLCRHLQTYSEQCYEANNDTNYVVDLCACQAGDEGDICWRECPCKSRYDCNYGVCAAACPDGDIGDACSDNCPCNGGYECNSGFCADVEHALCHASANTYYNTFDGLVYYFWGKCKYILAADCVNDEWEVITQNERIFCALTAFVTKVTFIIHNVLIPDETRIVIDLKGIKVNGVIISNSDLPIIGSSYNITNNAYSTKVDTGFGVSVTYHRRWFVSVNLDRRWFNRTCGLCGVWNGNTSDDIPSVSDPETFHEETLYGEDCGVTPVNYNCSRDDFAKAEQLCEKFLQKYFCPSVSYDPILEFCAFDVCVFGIDYLCRHLQTYSEQCYEATNDTKYVVDPCACQPGDDGDMCWSECPCKSPYDCNYGVCAADYIEATPTLVFEYAWNDNLATVGSTEYDAAVVHFNNSLSGVPNVESNSNYEFTDNVAADKINVKFTVVIRNTDSTYINSLSSGGRIRRYWSPRRSITKEVLEEMLWKAFEDQGLPVIELHVKDVHPVIISNEEERFMKTDKA